MQTILDYIEANLKTELTPEELAQSAGYSVSHFHRRFSVQMGMPPAAYILTRRLKNALYEIASGYTAIDVVMEYGFETYAGFYKAFVREYGCSPKKYIAIYGVPTKRPVLKELNTMSMTNKQIRDLLKNWDIDEKSEIGEVRYMHGAKIADDVFRIGEDHYLRMRDGKESQLRNIALAKAIAAQGLGSALPVLTKTGAEYLDGEILTILIKRVKGTPYEFLDQFGENRLRYAAECGCALGKLHKALLSVDVAAPESNLYQSAGIHALPNVQKQNVQWSMGLPDSFFSDYLETFGALQAKLPRQIIHRDPNPSNILFANDTVSGFIDFDLSQRNTRLYDPCYCATGVLCGAENEEHFEKWPEIAAQILRGYDRENPLTTEEKQSVYYVMCSIQLLCVSYFNTIDDPDFKRLTQKNRKMLQFIVANQEKLKKIF
ncbi:MAG TPA: helix-turn-helix domain-containing protein [Clostridiales bacterium]|nr:helix-turn-helix domain-containing protein [Clostridiales bacterium]HPK34406.1 helix-turn-helix domain-containing protein [Oscillospiraceae bacterium]HPR76509.1 helix-turn-helix domain-containing protein [Oscillospiraceae bacterium]